MHPEASDVRLRADHSPPGSCQARVIEIDQVRIGAAANLDQAPVKLKCSASAPVIKFTMRSSGIEPRPTFLFG